MSANERLSQLEQTVKTLLELARSASEREDTHITWINTLGEAQADTEAKIAALVNAQIRTEEALVKLSETQSISDAKITALAIAQIRTEEVLVKLSETQSISDAKIAALAEAQAKTNEVMTKLAQAQVQTDQRLNALIDIVREGLKGRTQE
jgi:alanyl-tRNA synthetase